MKYAMLVLTLVASVVNAGELGRIRNNAGGEIVLTTTECKDKSGFLAYGFSASSSDTIMGCHFLMDDAIWVKWNHDANPKRYPLEAVNFSEEILSKIKKNRQTY